MRAVWTERSKLIIHVKGFHPDYPCKRIPSRNCPWFIKISDKKYKKILADRVKRIKDNEKLKQEMMKDQYIVEEVKQNTKRLMQ